MPTLRGQEEPFDGLNLAVVSTKEAVSSSALPRASRGRRVLAEFLSRLRSRRLRGVRMFIGEKAHARGQAFPDGKSALMFVTARLKYVAVSEWGSKRYLDVTLLDERTAPGWRAYGAVGKCARILTVPPR